MRFDIISLFPEVFDKGLSGVVARSIDSGRIELEVTNPRLFAQDKHQTVDDRPYGGGDGMLMMAEPLKDALDSIQMEKRNKGRRIYLSPHGRTLTSKKAEELSKESSLVLICGRYGGIDQRIINSFVDEEISIGDYVLSGGELAAMVLVDSVARFIPGVVGNPDSPCEDSFQNGTLEGAQFTRPHFFDGQAVPEVFLSGDHKKIKDYRRAMSLFVTYFKRRDLFTSLISLQKTSFEELLKSQKALLSLSEQELSVCGINKDELKAVDLKSSIGGSGGER